MEIDRLLELLAARNSVQARLRSDEPIQLWDSGNWISANYPLTGGQLSRMLGLIATPAVRPFVHDLNAEYEFDHYHSTGNYRVHVKAVRGHRTVIVTRLDANGQLLRSMGDSDQFLDFEATTNEGQVASVPPVPTPAPVPVVAPTPASVPTQASIPTPAPAPPLTPTPDVPVVAQWKLEEAPVAEAIAPPAPAPKRVPAPAPRTIVSPGATEMPSVPAPGFAPSPPPGSHAMPQVTDQAHWFYGHAGQSMGPHTKEEMATLIASGALLRETMVFDSRVGDWQQAKLSALSGYFPLKNDGEWVNPSVANWRPQTAGEVKAEKAFVGLIGGGVVVGVLLLAGFIALAQVRGANSSFDYSQEFTAKVMKDSPSTSSGALHNVQLHRADGSLTHYMGTGQYVNNYLADVQVDIDKHDFWARPTDTPMTIAPHDFSSDLDAILYDSTDAGNEIDHVEVTHDHDNAYAGKMYFTDHTSKPITAHIIKFKDDGTIKDWRYDFIEDDAATGTR